ncbi:PhoD-like phosphatase N-terminal domain-containing protein [Streptomyces sp. INA 01156]
MGDPQPDGIVLWTRLAPDPLNGGGMPYLPVPVEWQLAQDARFRKVVRRGTGLGQARPRAQRPRRRARSRPDTRYWYRFRAEGQLSRTGRTRTAPPAHSTGGSCGSCSPPARTGSTATEHLSSAPPFRVEV